MDAQLDKHKASLEEMLGLLESTIEQVRTLKELAPGKRDVAVRRWVLMLGAMMLNVARSVGRLADSGDVAAIYILNRSIYEYKIKTLYFLKDSKTRRLAHEQYMTTATAYIQGLKRLPTMTEELSAQMDALQNAWFESGGKEDPYSGARGVTTMALELASPDEILTLNDRDKYTHDLSVSYHIPSWFVHGSAPLIGEFFSNLNDDSDWTLNNIPSNHTNVLPLLRSTISYLFVYMHAVRRHYRLAENDLVLPIKRAQQLQSPETRAKFKAMIQERNEKKS